jgi:signal transduction histidine kinase
MDAEELARLAARGLLAGAVASELAAPLERVARMLEAAVDGLDRHVATSRGPEPLPYHAVGALRERVADAFLDIGRVARLAADLASVVAAPLGRAPELVDVNELVERALSLARHRFGADGEVLLDLGTIPPMELDPARVVQVLAHLLLDAAAAPGTVTVTTAALRDGARVTVACAAAPSTRFADLVAGGLEAEGARITYRDEGGRTLAELTLVRRE